MTQPLAYIDPNAKIAENVVVEPFSTIYQDVEIGEGTWIDPTLLSFLGQELVKIAESFQGRLFLLFHKTLSLTEKKH
jgi:UDP-N-acetylglucosamine acyltransferase